jgi:hypothetical protein
MLEEKWNIGNNRGDRRSDKINERERIRIEEFNIQKESRNRDR